MTDHSALIERPCAATDQADLRDRIMNPNVAKSEAEWWASREIERLESALRDLTAVRKVRPSEAPDANGFIPWCGGQNPCPGLRVDAVWLSDVHYDRLSDELEWGRSHTCDPITAYRPLPSAPNQAKEAE